MCFLVPVLACFTACITYMFFESTTIFLQLCLPLHPANLPSLSSTKILVSSGLPSLGPRPSFLSLFYQQKQLVLVFLLLHLATPQNIPFTCRLHPLCPLAIPRPCFTQFLHFPLTSASELFAVKHIYTFYNV